MGDGRGGELTGEVPRDEHGGEDGALELPARVELLEAVHRLLPVDHGRDALPLLQWVGKRRGKKSLSQVVNVSFPLPGKASSWFT